jgi:hypothetical protein
MNSETSQASNSEVSEEKGKEAKPIGRGREGNSAAGSVLATIHTLSWGTDGAALEGGDKDSPGFTNNQAIAPRPAAAAAT